MYVTKYYLVLLTHVYFYSIIINLQSIFAEQAMIKEPVSATTLTRFQLKKLSSTTTYVYFSLCILHFVPRWASPRVTVAGHYEAVGSP